MLLHARMSNQALQCSVACCSHYRANVQPELTQHVMQVLSLYAKMMVWLEGADPTVCVQTNTWTAAALQLAIQFYKVLPWAPATCIYTCMLLTYSELLDRLPLAHHINVACVLVWQSSNLVFLLENLCRCTPCSMCTVGQCATEPSDNPLRHRGRSA